MRLEELLGLNDQLLGLLKKVPGKLRQGLRLHGLGLGLEVGKGDGEDGKLDGFPHIGGHENGNGHVEEMERLTSEESSINSSVEAEDGEEDATTPKVDKGKRKAEPEPEQPEMVLSPKTFMMAEPERDREYLNEERLATVSPDDRFAVSPSYFFFFFDDVSRLRYRSRVLVEEEGEVFRKGIVLLGPEEMEGDYAGEDLRREVRISFFP